MGASNVMDHIITFSLGRYKLLQFHIKYIEFIYILMNIILVFNKIFELI